MLLVGNVNVENLTRESEGVVGTIRIPFILARRLKRRSRVRLRYFGYHAGAFLTEIQVRQYEGNIGDEKADYEWRGACSEVRMRVEADGVSIMHDNTMVRSARFRDGVAQESEDVVDSLVFPATLATDAMNHSGNAAVQNDVLRPMAVHRAHHALSETTLGFIDPNVSTLEVLLSADHLPSPTNTIARYSFEPNVRMDTLSVVLELS